MHAVRARLLSESDKDSDSGRRSAMQSQTVQRETHRPTSPGSNLLGAVIKPVDG